MNIKRMTKSIEILEQVRDKNFPFNIKVWVENSETIEDCMDCNTAACAIGWICRSAWAQEQGLCITINNFGLNEKVEYPKYEEKISFNAIGMFFDISIEKATYLFTLDAYLPKDWMNYSDEDWQKEIKSVTLDKVIDRMKTML